MIRSKTQKGPYMKYILTSILIQQFLFTSCTLPSKRGTVSKETINSSRHLDAPYVLMISIDGYRSDYTKKYKPNFISSLANKGLVADGLIPIFPSKTFPNHFSIITGLTAEKHGIVANRFYDPKRKEYYILGNSKVTQDGSWYGGEPLWIATAKEGMISASYFWVGSDANIQNMHPTYYYDYAHNTPHDQRIDQVVRWFKLPKEKRPHFVTLYFSDVDSAGHHYGPDHEKVNLAIKKVDASIEKMMNELDQLNLPLNIVLVSDHGMKAIAPNGSLFLSDYTKHAESSIIQGQGAMMMIYEKNKIIRQKIYNDLKKVKLIKTYKKGELPPELGYTHHERIGDLILVVPPGNYLYKRPIVSGVPLKKASGGTHGYDPRDTKEMNGIFYAKGPNILPNKKIKSFKNIHIYPFIMNILNLKIKTKIDGSAKVLAPYLVK
jgi:predicted AlkP superfamily pyrophosphatase or phosphodiesterase